MRWNAIFLAATGVMSTAGVEAQAGDFRWSGAITGGQSIEVRGVNGSVRALPSLDGSVEVTAARTARRSEPGGVRVEVVEHERGVTVCAVYPTPPGQLRPNECRPGGGRNNVEGNDVRVDFVVRVPPGVRLVAVVSNGNIRAEGLETDVIAETVNGGVVLATTGAVEARTTNGDITGHVASPAMAGPLRFSTTNGRITVTLPSGVNADLHASTFNGSIQSDFPIIPRRRLLSIPYRRSLRGMLGEGGPVLRLSTFNGNVRLRREENRPAGTPTP